MPKPPPTPLQRNPHMSVVHALGHPSSPPPQTRWVQPLHGHAGTPHRLAMAMPNTPAAPVLVQGTGSNLTVTWTAPAVDSTHNAATGSTCDPAPPAPAVGRPCRGHQPIQPVRLAAGAAIDVQVQSLNAGRHERVVGHQHAHHGHTGRSPNAPAAASLAQGTGSNLTVTWTAPAVDGTHNAATGYQPAIQPLRRRHLDDRVGCHQPVHPVRLGSRRGDRRAGAGPNAAGTSAWSATSTLTTADRRTRIRPSAASLAQGTGSDLTVTWTAPAVDSTHNAATGYNLRSSPSGAGTWTTVSGVTSPYNLSGLAAAAAIDVQVQSSNAAGTSAWSATSTLTTATPDLRPERSGDRQRGAAAGRHQHQAYRHLDCAGGRRHARRRNRVTTSAPAPRRRHMDDGDGCHQSLHAHRPDRCDRNRRRGPGARTPRQAGAWSTDHDGHDLGRDGRAGQPGPPRASQVHSTNVAPNGGVKMTAVRRTDRGDRGERSHGRPAIPQSRPPA